MLQWDATGLIAAAVAGIAGRHNSLKKTAALIMNIFVIIPAYNESATISAVVTAVLAIPAAALRLIVIDDGSTDATPDIVARLVAQHPRIQFIRNTTNRGYAETIRRGMQQVPADAAFITVMADGCDEITLIPHLVDEVNKGADIACASRYIKGGSRQGGNRLKHYASIFLNAFFAQYLKLPCHDLTNSFKLIRKHVIDAIRLESRGFDIFLEIVLKAYQRGYHITEVPTIWQERKAGRSTFRILRHGCLYAQWVGYLLTNRFPTLRKQ